MRGSRKQHEQADKEANQLAGGFIATVFGILPPVFLIATGVATGGATLVPIAMGTLMTAAGVDIAINGQEKHS